MEGLPVSGNESQSPNKMEMKMPDTTSTSARAFFTRDVVVVVDEVCVLSFLAAGNGLSPKGKGRV